MTEVLVVCDSLDPSVGGAEISARDMIWLLFKRGFKVEFLTASTTEGVGSGSIEIREERFSGWYFRAGALLQLRNFRGMLNFRSLLAILRAVRSKRPDIIIFNNVSDQISYSAMLQVKLLGIPSIHVLRDTTALTHGKFVYKERGNKFRVAYGSELRRAGLFINPFRVVWAKFCLAQVDLLIAISEELRRFFSSNGVRVNRVIHNGVILETLPPFDQARVFSSGKVVLWPARFSVLKGALVVLDMFGEITDPTIKLVITADKTDIADSRILKALESHENIIFTGWLPRLEVERLYAEATLVVYPSMYLEPFGRVPVEAMARRKPVIVSNKGGLPEIVSHDFNGLVIDPQNKFEFAHAVKKMCSDVDWAKRLGDNGFQRYQEKFTGDFMIDNYISAIEDLVRAHD